MGRNRKPPPARHPAVKAEKSVFASPFKDLKKMLGAPVPGGKPTDRQTPAAPAPKSIAPGLESALDDETIFLQAVDGVRQLGGRGARRVAPKPEVKNEIVSEDAEVLAQLSDLVSGQGRFELTETEEYVEGARLGLDPRLLTRLRRGEFAVQAHIDLHGMIQADARTALQAFIVESVHKGLRAVLIIHGRGRRSPGGMPVLKHAAAQWLSHGLTGGYVLAFATARPTDGGAGAMYVLLRRQRQRAAFDVLHGAKRRE